MNNGDETMVARSSCTGILVTRVDEKLVPNANLNEYAMLWDVFQLIQSHYLAANSCLSLSAYTSCCCAGYASGDFMGDVKV